MRFWVPTNGSDLRSILDLSTYDKFLPNVAILSRPLYDLLANDSLWKWIQAEKNAFRKSKQVLAKAGMLTHFDVSEKLSLECDVSPYVVGTVLYH